MKAKITSSVVNKHIKESKRQSFSHKGETITYHSLTSLEHDILQDKRYKYKY